MARDLILLVSVADAVDAKGSNGGANEKSSDCDGNEGIECLHSNLFSNLFLFSFNGRLDYSLFSLLQSVRSEG